MPQPSVAIVGHVCIDHNKSEHATYTGWGSAALYMAQVLSEKYQLPTQVISNYGPDLLPHLPAVSLVPNVPTQGRTLVYENDSISTPGMRVQRCHNVDVAGPPALTADVKQLLAEADIVVVAVLLPNYGADYVRELLACAKPTALKVLCPQGYFRQIDAKGLVRPGHFTEADMIVHKFDLIVYSDEDHPKAFTIARNWKQAAVDTQIVITQGADGATIVHADFPEPVPTLPVPPEDVVDSVGCGDVFAAALAYAYSNNKDDLPVAVKAAHRVAADKLKGVGAGIAAN